MQLLIDNLNAIAAKVPVTWDRFTVDAANNYTVYGWVARRDGYRDFVLVSGQETEEEFLIGFTTSSAKYSAAIATILYGDTEEHNTCRPISKLLNTVLS